MSPRAVTRLLIDRTIVGGSSSGADQPRTCRACSPTILPRRERARAVIPPISPQGRMIADMHVHELGDVILLTTTGA
jgi:hypothetical protein